MASSVTGIDACPGGWVAVTLSGDSDGAAAMVSVARTLDGLALADVTGIDMPLGLLAAGWRTADLLARRALGRRGSSVFAIPPRPVWQESRYADANLFFDATPSIRFGISGQYTQVSYLAQPQLPVGLGGPDNPHNIRGMGQAVYVF